ncbi:P-loop containing nucleoside triphosphate hydrolase protein [Stachybotrys elegans]|uniref:RNA helicase n=1 Tax=Stachybotrys elegans TaxID=80388 RepID=A0A8K0WPP1_9HYPO|nr:P-loop containing nucleoside triphosphate hydrolase protein [Stachybotrys elegans]
MASEAPNQEGWVEAKDEEALANVPVVTAQKWDGSAKVYQWNDEFGDVGPKFPDLEVELFGAPESRHEVAGLDFSRIEEIEVHQEGPRKIDPIGTFNGAGLHPVMLENVELCGYQTPTPIQKFTIPSILQGHDVIGIAQTGSGKTAAYLIPILSKLMGKAKKLAAPRPNPVTFREGIDGVCAEPLVLIVAPTRELAVQIFNEARKLCYRTMLRPCVVYGGIPVMEQINLLQKGCDILVGTPGRLVDSIQRPRVLTLRRLKHIVIDEADEMLDAGWEDDLQQILGGGEQDEGNVSFYLFSATFPKAARDLAKEYLAASHVRFRVGRAGSTTENIQQIVLQAEGHEKRDMLVKLLETNPGVRTIIFVNSRREADNLDAFLWNLGLPVTSIHSDRSQVEREAALRAFRAGTAPILVATGVTARGIDVPNVMHVINYDLPSIDHGGIEEYTHRIGRTGRIGHRGVATSLFSERDIDLASVLTRTLLETNQEIPEFLESYKPADTDRKHLKFETESDFDPNDVAGANDMGGAPAGDGSAPGWGSGEAQGEPAASGGWGASNGDAAAETGAWGSGGGDAVAADNAWGVAPDTTSKAPGGW